MDSAGSTFINNTMDSIGDSILNSPKDIGEGRGVQGIEKAGRSALEEGMEKAENAATAQVEMAADKGSAFLAGDNIEGKSLTDLNDNQYLNQLKTSASEKVELTNEDIMKELESGAGAVGIDPDNLNSMIDSRKQKASQEINEFGDTADANLDSVKTSAGDNVSKTAEDIKGFNENLSTGSETKKDSKGEVIEVVKTAAMTAVADVQGGATVEVAAKKAVKEVVTNVGPDIGSTLSAGFSSLTSGSPEPEKSFSSTSSSSTAVTTNKAEPRVTFSDTPDTTSKVTSPTSKTTPITVLVTDTNKTTANISHGAPALRRQPSTESRDNPFIPDGELSKETDELLKRATIIRDKFYLDQQERERKGLPALDVTDNVNAENSPIVESVVAPVSAQAAQSQVKGLQPVTAEVKPRMRENGKVEDSVSPEGIKPEIEKRAADPIADGSKTSPGPSTDNDKEKKKQKKCCTIM